MEQTTHPRPGYAGVTVWIGDKSITRVVPEEALDKPYYDPLAVLFADANADLRSAHFWGENRPANVRTCLPDVQRIDTSPERVEETAKRVHDDVELPPCAVRTSAFNDDGVIKPYYTADQLRAAVLADREKHYTVIVRVLEHCRDWLPEGCSAHEEAVYAIAALSAQEGTTDCWCESCRPNTFDSMRMIVCQTCGNKRCPHATDHRNACTGSNEPGQPGSSYENVRPWNPSGAQEGKQ